MENAHQIYDDDNVLRRVPTFLPNYIKEDGTISRMAFNPRKDAKGLSVDLEKLSSFEKASLNQPDRFRILKVNVGTIRNEINDGLDVILDPMKDNESHSLIIGKITKGKQNQLLKASSEMNIS